MVLLEEGKEIPVVVNRQPQPALAASKMANNVRVDQWSQSGSLTRGCLSLRASIWTMLAGIGPPFVPNLRCVSSSRAKDEGQTYLATVVQRQSRHHPSVRQSGGERRGLHNFRLPLRCPPAMHKFIGNIMGWWWWPVWGPWTTWTLLLLDRQPPQHSYFTANERAMG